MDERFLEEFQTLALIGGPRRLAIDVGANKGEWTRWMASYFDEVICLEPDWRARGMMRQLGIPANATLLPAAAGAVCGAADFYLRDDNQQSSMQPEHPIGGGDQRPVETVAVDKVGVLTLTGLAEWGESVWPGHKVDLVKIDAEGFEHEVLAGVASVSPLFDSTRWIIEIHDRVNEVGHQLQRLGYQSIRVMKHPNPGAHPQHCWVYVPSKQEPA
jgi:FkbM family methyltransferase